MTQTDQAAAPLPTRFERLIGFVAMLGGLLALATACMVVISVVGRKLFNMPVEGDFEMVKMATAVAVFTFLPLTQSRRGNIMVETFTGWMRLRAQRWLDAVWDCVYAIFMGFCAVGLAAGARDAWRSGETTMQLQFMVWPAIGLCAALCFLLVLSSLLSAVRLIGTGK
jgi:TRAP-type C4-dicarboxylate transport system permease small subunit